MAECPGLVRLKAEFGEAKEGKEGLFVGVIHGHFGTRHNQPASQRW